MTKLPAGFKKDYVLLLTDRVPVPASLIAVVLFLMLLMDKMLSVAPAIKETPVVLLWIILLLIIESSPETVIHATLYEFEC